MNLMLILSIVNEKKQILLVFLNQRKSQLAANNKEIKENVRKK